MAQASQVPIWLCDSLVGAPALHHLRHHFFPALHHQMAALGHLLATGHEGNAVTFVRFRREKTGTEVRQMNFPFILITTCYYVLIIGICFWIFKLSQQLVFRWIPEVGYHLLPFVQVCDVYHNNAPGPKDEMRKEIRVSQSWIKPLVLLWLQDWLLGCRISS